MSTSSRGPKAGVRDEPPCDEKRRDRRADWGAALMSPRWRSLMRDAWWLLPLLLGVSVFFGFVLHPLVGIVLPVVMAPVFVYFAMIRYDSEGRDAER